MPRALYTLLLRLILPGVLLALWWRGRRTGRPVNLAERLARFSAGAARPGLAPRPLWVHGVSVGEVQSAVPLLRALHARDPARPLLLTTATATGHERARRLLSDLLEGSTPSLRICFAPFDLPGAARRFVQQHRPCAAVFLETEIWPNLIAALAAAQVPTAIVSARVSERSVGRYLRLARSLIARTVERLQLVGAQTEIDAARFRQLGAVSSAVQVTGNLKFDFALPADIHERGQALRAQYASTRGLWVAGSTHPGEEHICLEAQAQLAQRAAAAGMPAPLLVLAPRHPERFDAVAEMLEDERVPFVRRSGSQESSSEASVLLVDGLGELLGFYAAADVTFVGGSLVGVGGHNLLEPAALERTVVTGPHSFNSPEAARLLEAADALVRVGNADSLADAVWAALGEPEQAARRGSRAAAAVAASRGAAARTLAALEPLLPG